MHQLPMNNNLINSIQDITQRQTKLPRTLFTRELIAKEVNMNTPDPNKNAYVDILFKHEVTININKHNLGLAEYFTHKINIKDNQLIYRK
jgi:hypothetical protein